MTRAHYRQVRGQTDIINIVLRSRSLLKKSEIAPAFGQPRGGTQYRIVTPEGQSIRVNVDYLIKNGYLIK